MLRAVVSRYLTFAKTSFVIILDVDCRVIYLLIVLRYLSGQCFDDLSLRYFDILILQ